ncbi:unnamed protein product [Eruca vesicaria subsp. sativa]|uniref:Uncharacterized protein n=1 Tax=Eruca vesicaria subsp. sativa TaxID=29727 RepID=A0ABC8K1B6_ERUVS|nr:unnamed protein product [Eruca vesicaria subsp. sativa]
MLFLDVKGENIVSGSPWNRRHHHHEREKFLDINQFLNHVTKIVSGTLDLSLQWKEYKEMMELMVKSVRKQSLDLQEEKEDSDLEESLGG